MNLGFANIIDITVITNIVTVDSIDTKLDLFRYI